MKKINACHNALDRHVSSGNGSDFAIIWEGVDSSLVRKLTDSEVLKDVCQMANAMLSHGGEEGM